MTEHDLHLTTEGLLLNSREYQQLQARLGEMEAQLGELAGADTLARVKHGALAAELRTRIEGFEFGVNWLAQTFELIGDKASERVARARGHFDKSEFAEARAVLKTDLELIRYEHGSLLARKENLAPGQAFKLDANAKEFLVLAQLTAIGFENPNWFEEACEFTELSIAALPSFENLYYYVKFLQQQDQFHLAEPHLVRIFAEFSGNMGPWDRSSLLDELARLHRAAGKFDEAELEFNEAIEIALDLAAADPDKYLPALAASMNNLGRLHSVRKQHLHAIENYRSSIDIARQLAAPTYRPRLALVLFNLGKEYRTVDQAEAAIESFTEALDIWRERAADDLKLYLPLVVDCLTVLAPLRRSLKDHKKAEAEFVEAIEIRKALAAEDPQTNLPQVAALYNGLAITHKQMRLPDAAEIEYREALAIYRQLVSSGSEKLLPELALTVFNLAILHGERNENEAAESEYAEALAIRRKLAAKDPPAFLPLVADTLNNLAMLHRTLKNIPAAENEYTEALAIRRELAAVDPQTHLPKLAETLTNLGVLHRSRNEYAAAENEYTEALAIRRELAAKEPEKFLPGVADTLNNLAVLHRSRKEYKAAEEEYGEALAIRRELATKDPEKFLPDVAMTLVNLAIFYQSAKPDRERSLALALEGNRLMASFTGREVLRKKILAAATGVLENWGLTETEIAGKLGSSQ